MTWVTIVALVVLCVTTILISRAIDKNVRLNEEIRSNCHATRNAVLENKDLVKSFTDQADRSISTQGDQIARLSNRLDDLEQRIEEGPGHQS